MGFPSDEKSMRLVQWSMLWRWRNSGWHESNNSVSHSEMTSIFNMWRRTYSKYASLVKEWYRFGFPNPEVRITSQRVGITILPMLTFPSFNSLQHRVEYEDSCWCNGPSRISAEDTYLVGASELPPESCDSAKGATVVEADREDAVVVVTSDRAKGVILYVPSRG